jgi:hypothetical protein
LNIKALSTVGERMRGKYFKIGKHGREGMK